MARSIPPHRFQDLVEAATQVFIAQGYRGTQMADIAEAMGVAKGTVYLYVESKDALFDQVLRQADPPPPIAQPSDLPIRSPAPGSTIGYVRDRLTEQPASPTLARALRHPRARDPRAELDAVVSELSQAIGRHRTRLKLVDRCAPEYPDLAKLWFGAGREALLGALTQYLETRIRGHQFLAVPDVRVAARFIIETVVFWAVHRHWDPAPQVVDAQAAEDTVAQLIVTAFVAEAGR